MCYLSKNTRETSSILIVCKKNRNKPNVRPINMFFCFSYKVNKKYLLADFIQSFEKYRTTFSDKYLQVFTEPWNMDPIECAEIVQWNPELILISESPVTWEGMLTVPSVSSRRNRLRIKLILPNYPQLDDANLTIGRKLTSLCNKGFNEKFVNLVQNATTVSSFLRQLQIIVGDIFRNDSELVAGAFENTGQDVLKELENALNTSCDIRLPSNSDLNTVELNFRDIRVKLQRDISCVNSWKIVSTDLPQLPGSEMIEGAILTLCDAANKLKMQVELLGGVWEELKDIDRNCWVIDPLQPKPYHLHRRIRLASSLSVLITVNPSKETILPDIRLLGSDIEVAKYEDIMSRNLEKIDPECSLLNNLKTFLGLYEFPSAPLAESPKEEDGMVGDEECCICFSLQLDGGELPNKMCNNEKCRRNFHTECLLQWLQAIAGNQMVFGLIHGACPHCGETISCPVASH